MVDRRSFLKSVAAAGGTIVVQPIHAMTSRRQDSKGYFDVHSFVKNNPDAVFIMKTKVTDYVNGPEKAQAGLDFARSVILPSDTGIPLTTLIPIKPNIRYEQGWNYNYQAHKTVLEQSNRIPGYNGTDAFFVEGLIEAMKELGLSGSQFFIRECNMHSTGSVEYPDIAKRTGAELRVMADKVGVISENDLVWAESPTECVWFKKMPYLWPINAPDTWLLNIAKFKAHGMGLTLTGKNLQGALCHDYQELCSAYHTDGSGDMNIDQDHFKADAHDVMKSNYARHVADGIPRWDRPGSTWNSGLGMERWATRTVDNHMSSNVGLHVIEGIYGRDGDGFSRGPHPDGRTNDLPMDFMTNIIIFGKNPFHVDSIGHWLGGHEPGNLGYLHIALERGVSSILNPHSIPVYEWKSDGTATLTPLDQFERTPLLTYYLRRDYNGQSESYWHMLDEPFDYKSVSDAEPDAQPEAFLLHQNIPNPFNPYTTIEFSIPTSGNARLEIFNSSGQLVDVLVNGYMSLGSHMAVWDTGAHASGTYFYRFRFGGFNETKKMTLLK